MHHTNLSSTRTLLCFAFVAAAGCFSCGVARTPFLLETLNKAPSTPPPRPAASERIAREVSLQLIDSYLEPATVVAWLHAVGTAAEAGPIANHLFCLRSPPLGNPAQCYSNFEDQAQSPDAWSLPPPPAQVPLPATAAYFTELDTERFVANARSVASSLSVLERSIGRELTSAELRDGIALGAARASAYIQARRWQRQKDRPTVGLVLSGGAATGAFSAGFVYRLMEVLATCRTGTGTGAASCPNAKIDLVVGTSTGSLIGAILDLYQVPGREQAAEALLVDNFTCSVEKDLYCQHDEYDWNLAQDLRGLMRFRGIEKKLTETLVPEMQTNGTELVTVSVDYESGAVFAQSDQDPADRAAGADRVQTVLASIVEPVLSDPVDYVMRDGKRVNGTFIDGGIRSGIPMLQAVRRGAERVLVLANWSVDPDPAPHQKAAVPILLRTLDLAVNQNTASEVQHAELEAAARRFGEYEFCSRRLNELARSERDEFCRRDNLWPPAAGPEAAVAGFIGPGLFPTVAKSWSSEWVFRPENGAPGAGGYTFDPKAMRLLFEDGARNFQRRCRETLSLMSIPLAVADLPDVCQLAPDAAAEHVRTKFKPLDACIPESREIPECE